MSDVSPLVVDDQESEPEDSLLSLGLGLGIKVPKHLIKGRI